MSEAVLMGASTAFSVLSFVFFCCGASAASFHWWTLEIVSWVYTHVPGVAATGDDMFNSGEPRYTLYFGLRSFATITANTEIVTSLNDCGDNSVCNACNQSGDMVLPLISLCVFFSFVAVVISIVRMQPGSVGNKVLKFSGMLTTFLTIAFSIAAFASYAPCHRAIKKEYPNNAIWGPGAGLSVAAWISIMFAFVLQAYKSSEQAAANQKPEPVPQEVQLSVQA